jgi:hypothetical protein
MVFRVIMCSIVGVGARLPCACLSAVQNEASCHTAKGDDQGYGDQVLSADPGRHVLQIHLGILLALFRDTISQKAIDFGRGPMGVGQGAQVLVTCLEQRPLGIEDIEKLNLPSSKPFVAFS